MTRSILEVEAQRAQWERRRHHEGLAGSTGDRFALGGLGAHAGAEARLLILPADPDGQSIHLDSDTLAWVRQERDVPNQGEPFPRGHRARAVTDAVVLYDQYRDDGPWERYLAVHCHGGVEAGLGRAAYDLRDIRVFGLAPIVGMAWVAAAVQQKAIEKWNLRGPFEATLALRETRGTTLGHFANGWAEPGQGLFDFPYCLDDHVLLRVEIEQSIDPEQFATIMGDRIELAFGTTNRRHLPRQR